ncbi:MAG TPA: DUF4388 domain-containing protein [Chloroflexia bacterium]|nr:DUF4388 domain-containing protein [Chloroflexia bacterium]
MGELNSASVTLAEIIAYIKQTRQTGRLLVRLQASPAPPAGPAVLSFEHGHLIDARCGPEVGDDLVYRLLGNREAAYAFDRSPPEALPAERSITRVQEFLMLAAIGLLSEEDTGPPNAQQTQAFEAATQAPPEPAPAPPPERRKPRPFKRRNMIPLPPGEPAYTAVTLPPDFVALLDLLERDQLAGYVTWFSEGAEGLLLLYQGQVIDAFWAEVHSPATYAERHAVRRFAAAVGTEGHRQVEVYTLDADFVWSYSSLAYGAHQASEQGLEHVQLPALLARLATDEHTGCIKVVAGTQAAYLFLGNGHPLGEYRALPESLESAPGRTRALITQPGSLVDIYTSPTPAELLALNAAAWPVERVVVELRRTAQDVLGPKAGQVLTLITTAGTDPRALHAACARAKKATRVFIGPEKHAELSRRLDRLLAHLQ